MMNRKLLSFSLFSLFLSFFFLSFFRNVVSLLNKRIFRGFMTLKEEEKNIRRKPKLLSLSSFFLSSLFFQDEEEKEREREKREREEREESSLTTCFLLVLKHH